MILAGLLVLGACGTTRSDLEITSGTPASVTVWGRDTYCLTCRQTEAVSDQQMTDEASRHCARYAKVARRSYEKQYETGRSITFDCVAE